MKLIDLLVQELPKRGGWPCNEVAYQDDDLEIRFMGGEGVTSGDFFANVLCSPDGDDLDDCKGIRHAGPVTRKQYEVALLASQQPAWNGEGVPPVGCECEAYVQFGISGFEWRKVKVVHTGHPATDKEGLVFDLESTRPCWADKFRPIYSETERKREEVIESLMNQININIFDARELYDHIATGKIPGVKLAD